MKIKEFIHVPKNAEDTISSGTIYSISSAPQTQDLVPQNNSKNYTCEFCKKTYSRIDSLNRHKKNYCRVIKSGCRYVQNSGSISKCN